MQSKEFAEVCARDLSEFATSVGGEASVLLQEGSEVVKHGLTEGYARDGVPLTFIVRECCRTFRRR